MKKAPETPAASEDYVLSFEERPQYLYAFVSGERDSYEISQRYWEEIGRECKRLSCRKVLVEEDISMPLPMPEMYQLASELPQMGFFGVYVAFVDRHAEHLEANEFGELVASNRGINIKTFGEFAAAEKWLLAD